MPAVNETYWRKRMLLREPCHYHEYWQDLYAQTIRRAAVERLFPCYDPALHTKTGRVLDVGCGDGKFGQWVGKRFDVEVTGVDLMEYAGVCERLFHFVRWDAENVGVLPFSLGAFDVALLITVLPFVRDWGKALQGLMRTARFVLIVDNLQFPPPTWQAVNYKQHIPLPQLLETADALGYAIDRVEPVNVLDRRVFLKMPRALYPLAFGVTLAADAVLARLPQFRGQARYWAVLLRNPLV